MPLSIEPSKPRLLHDQQYLNCFMQQCLFSLNQVVNLARYLSQNSFHTKLNDKSGFDHFFISEDSQPLMGAEWGGWWLVWRTLPQGWKESPYVYQTLGSVATNALRELVLPCFQYIDDRHLGELWGPVAQRSSSLDAANAAFFYTLENVFQFLRSISFFLATSSIPPVKPSLKVHCASRENAIK